MMLNSDPGYVSRSKLDIRSTLQSSLNANTTHQPPPSRNGLTSPSPLQQQLSARLPLASVTPKRQNSNHNNSIDKLNLSYLQQNKATTPTAQTQAPSSFLKPAVSSSLRPQQQTLLHPQQQQQVQPPMNFSKKPSQNSTTTTNVSSKLSAKEATSFSQDRMNVVLRNNFNKNKTNTSSTNMHLANKTQVLNSFQTGKNSTAELSTSFTRATSGSVPKNSSFLLQQQDRQSSKADPTSNTHHSFLNSSFTKPNTSESIPQSSRLMTKGNSYLSNSPFSGDSKNPKWNNTQLLQQQEQPSKSAASPLNNSFLKKQSLSTTAMKNSFISQSSSSQNRNNLLLTPPLQTNKYSDRSLLFTTTPTLSTQQNDSYTHSHHHPEQQQTTLHHHQNQSIHFNDKENDSYYAQYDISPKSLQYAQQHQHQSPVFSYLNNNNIDTVAAPKYGSKSPKQSNSLQLSSPTNFYSSTQSSLIAARKKNFSSSINAPYQTAQSQGLATEETSTLAHTQNYLLSTNAVNSSNSRSNSNSINFPSSFLKAESTSSFQQKQQTQSFQLQQNNATEQQPQLLPLIPLIQENSSNTGAHDATYSMNDSHNQSTLGLYQIPTATPNMAYNSNYATNINNGSTSFDDPDFLNSTSFLNTSCLPAQHHKSSVFSHNVSSILPSSTPNTINGMSQSISNLSLHHNHQPSICQNSLLNNTINNILVNMNYYSSAPSTIPSFNLPYSSHTDKLKLDSTHNHNISQSIEPKPHQNKCEVQKSILYDQTMPSIKPITRQFKLLGNANNSNNYRSIPTPVPSWPQSSHQINTIITSEVAIVTPYKKPETTYSAVMQPIIQVNHIDKSEEGIYNNFSFSNMANIQQEMRPTQHQNKQQPQPLLDNFANLPLVESKQQSISPEKSAINFIHSEQYVDNQHSSTNSSLAAPQNLQNNIEFQSANNSNVIRFASPYAESLLLSHIWSIDQFQVGKCLGRGRFGNVHLCRHKPTNMLFAVKQINKKNLIDSCMEKQLQQGIKIQTYINHPNILHLHGFFDDSTKIYLMLELASHGDIYKEIKREQSKRFSEEKAANYIRQVCEGLIYLHSQGIIHRDIKPENILNSFGVIKLSDFGWSIYTEEKRMTFCGTLDYVSPEVVSGKDYDFKVDIWSIGVLTYELVTGKPPFENRQNHHDSYQKILMVKYEFPDYLSGSAKDFMSKLLVSDPNKRISLEDALNHDWIINNTSNCLADWDPTVSEQVLGLLK